MTKYMDCETGEIISREDLEKEYEILKKDGETEAATFAEYLRNVTEKNGFLVEIR